MTKPRDMTTDPRNNPPKPLRAPAKRGIPGSQPPLITPPKSPPPPFPVALRPPAKITPTNPPPPDIHKGRRGTPPGAMSKVNTPLGDRPTIGITHPLAPEGGPQPRGVFAGTPPVSPPQKDYHRAMSRTNEPEPVEKAKPAPGSCEACGGTKMINVLKNMEGVIYSFRPCTKCKEGV